MNNFIYHITTAEKWQAAQDSGEYLPMEYMADGYIHAAFYHQLKSILDFLFASHDKVLVLEINPALLQCKVKTENTTGGKELFPHIYGTFPPGAVVRSFYLEQDQQGFVIPEL